VKGYSKQPNSAKLMYRLHCIFIKNGIFIEVSFNKQINGLQLIILIMSKTRAKTRGTGAN